MIARRQLLKSLVAASLFPSLPSLSRSPRPIRLSRDLVDWLAVRDLFPLAPDWTHLSSFLFVSHPKPVAEAIDHFRKKLDSDAMWIEIAAFTDAEGRPFTAVKRALAEYSGGSPAEIAFTSNTTTGLAMVYHGLRIRGDQEIVTTEHDHYSHHESIRYAAARSGCGVRYIALFDQPATARADQIVDRIARAITPATRAVGVTWVQSSTGIKLPVAGIADVVARANRGRAPADRCLLIVDGVHGFANQDVDVARLGADFFASGTHKWLFARAARDSCGAGAMPGRTFGRRSRASIPTPSTRRSAPGPIVRSCRRRRRPSCPPAASWPTSICSRSRRRWSCIERSDATRSRRGLRSSTRRSGRARPRFPASPCTRRAIQPFPPASPASRCAG